MSNQGLEFSVCIPVYHKEKIDNFRACLESMVKQTVLPNEILLLTDDPSTDELNQIIKEYSRSIQGYSWSILYREAAALVEYCKMGS
jgi:glycosyltransferase involved in cell wall biosynthesis